MVDACHTIIALMATFILCASARARSLEKEWEWAGDRALLPRQLSFLSQWKAHEPHSKSFQRRLIYLCSLSLSLSSVSLTHAKSASNAGGTSVYCSNHVGKGQRRSSTAR